MRAELLWLSLMCVAAAACSKRNPELCCVTPAECERAGFDSPAPCAGNEVCVDNACQVTGCDGDEDCARPLVCSANQCVQPPDWVARHGGSGEDVGAQIAAAPNGDLIVAGDFSALASFGGDALVPTGATSAWVARYRSDGSFLWSVMVGDSEFATTTGVAVDSNGDVYLTGWFMGSGNFGSGTVSAKTGSFIVKLSGADGSYEWDHTFGASAVFGNVAALDGNRVVVCGLFQGGVDFGGGTLTSTRSDMPDNFLVVYDHTGAQIWAKALAATNAGGYYGKVVAAGGDILLANTFQGTAMLGGSPLIASGTADMFVARYSSSDGHHVWSIAHGGTSESILNQLTSDGDRVFVGGQFRGTTNLGGAPLTAMGMTDGFAAAYNVDDGGPLWSESFGATNASDGITSIAAGAGRLTAAIEFDLSPLVLGGTTLTPVHDDVALVRLNPDTGAPTTTANQFSSTKADSATSVSLSIIYTGDRLAGTGWFPAEANLLGNRVISAGMDDVVSFRVDF